MSYTGDDSIFARRATNRNNYVQRGRCVLGAAGKGGGPGRGGGVSARISNYISQGCVSMLAYTKETSENCYRGILSSQYLIPVLGGREM